MRVLESGVTSFSASILQGYSHPEGLRSELFLLA